MMEFYNESKHKSRKERRCEMCGDTIRIGEYYYSERGKWEGCFFNRDLHVHCHNMEREYCSEVETEFSWDDISAYIQDKYCGNCEHAACNYKLDGWEECDFYVTDCPKIKRLFSDREGETDDKDKSGT